MLLWMQIGFFLLGLVLAYFLIVRPVLRSHHFFNAYYVREEGFLTAIKAFRTMMLAKLAMFGTFLLMVHDFLMPIATGGGIDWTPVTAVIPTWAWPFMMFGMAAIFAWLRQVTTTPPAQPAPLLGSDPATGA